MTRSQLSHGRSGDADRRTSVHGTTRRLAALGIAGLLFVAACGSDGDNESTPEESATSTGAETASSAAPADSDTSDQFTIGLVSPWCANPTVCAAINAFKAEAEALGHKAISVEADQSDPVNSQIAGIDQLIAQGVDAIAIWPLDDAAMQAPMERAADAGIALFSHDLYTDTNDLLVSTIVQGRELKAKQSAELMCQQSGAEGVQVLYGNLFLEEIETLIQLKDAFIKYAGECENPIEIVATFLNESDDVDGAQPAAEAALLAHPEADAAFNYNDPTGIGASIAATALGRELYIDGYNLSQDGIDALTAGRLTVSWDYRAPEVGQTIARTMIEYLDGTNPSPDEFIVVWPKGYTPDTIGDFVSAEDRIAKIKDGVYLLDEDPLYTTSANGSLPSPSPDIPLPVLAGS